MITRTTAAQLGSGIVCKLGRSAPLGATLGDCGVNFSVSPAMQPLLICSYSILTCAQAIARDQH